MASFISGNTRSKTVKTPAVKKGPVQNTPLGEGIPTESPKTMLKLKPWPHGVTGKV